MGLQPGDLNLRLQGLQDFDRTGTASDEPRPGEAIAMTNPLSFSHRYGLTLLFALALPLLAQANEPLPSWNDGPAKKNIIEFVQTVTDQSSK